MTDYAPATRPTLYFIGVTTTQSSIMRVFPRWAERLGLGDCEIRGMDFPLHADPTAYRRAVEFIRDDPMSLGALVTTHKIDLYEACRDLFDTVDDHAAVMGEVSSLSKRKGALVAHAKDPISSGLALDGFLPEAHFAASGGKLFSMGAGGSTIAILWHLGQQSRGADRPAELVVSNRSTPRLESLRAIASQIDGGLPLRLVHAPEPSGNGQVLAELPPGSLVINATGLGKDAPGSPLDDEAVFPRGAIAWDLNYRGDLRFLTQARHQAADRGLQVEDGWTYFIHGWTRVIAEVFDVSIPTRGPVFDDLSAIAAAARSR